MLVETLLETAKRRGDQVAVADPTRSLTYKELVRLSDVMRRQVQRASNRQNVGILLPSTTVFAGAFFGTLWAGRTVVPLNFLLQPDELAKVVDDSDIDVIFTIRHFEELASATKARKIYIEDLPLKREMILSYLRFRPAPPKVNENDTAVLLYTSGTSGVPKGVLQTYRNLRTNIDACIEAARLTGEHHFLGVLPLFHSFGITTMLLVPVRLGARVYYLPKFNPNLVFKTVREQKSTIVMVIASMYTALLRSKSAKAEDLASLTFAISGGEALSPMTFEAFKSRFNVEILQGYGMSEAAPVVSLSMPWAHRAGKVGKPIAGVSVRAFDDNGKELVDEEIGELWVKGPNVMAGYYKKPEETKAVLTDDGWYKTGDMGCVDADGFIQITGRKKEMIIVGGENVYPREIETALEAHDAVNEAAVIGQQDPSRGEVPVAFVTLIEGADSTETELREFCRGKVAGYKVPRRVIISKDLPRGPTGKILKRELNKLL
ncbi:MAG: AMP-binding protein [Phycisphaerales bacterium]|nr:AMP-binding protein [Phycisphaerales bacterium]MCB9857509.1 AMP-binding protein [Phycisphaerales bacterium]MCB9864506.1 AMP-binding protein [Phycisphaerales bacterium]